VPLNNTIYSLRNLNRSADTSPQAIDIRGFNNNLGNFAEQISLPERSMDQEALGSMAADVQVRSSYPVVT
jgi:hypothetical protein